MAMLHLLKSLAKFVTALLAMTILCTMVWQFVGDKLYDCTDDGFLGFWRPGEWVHSFGGHSVATLHQVVHGRSMSESDTIKEGWSVAGLWRLWFRCRLAGYEHLSCLGTVDPETFNRARL